MPTLPDPGQPFEGAVQLTDWAKTPWSDRQVIGLYGKVRFHSTLLALGFEMGGGGHANWLLTVEGNFAHTYVVPGCKVQLVLVGIPPDGMRNADFCVVP